MLFSLLRLPEFTRTSSHGTDFYVKFCFHLLQQKYYFNLESYVSHVLSETCSCHLVDVATPIYEGFGCRSFNAPLQDMS